MTEQVQTRRERVEAREEALVSVARTLFNEKGFAGTTMAEIARTAGVADGTVYIYFKNKEAVARAVLEQFYMELTASAQVGVDALSAPEERVRFLAKNHLESVTANWRLMEMLPLMDLKADVYEGSALHALNKTYVAVFDRVAKDGRSQGVMRDDLTPWIMRDIFFGAMEHGARSMVFSKGINHLGAIVENLARLFFMKPDRGPDQVTRLEAAIGRLESLAERTE